MENSEIKVVVKLIDILHAPLIDAWNIMCDKYGINEWCLNEGLANDSDTIEITLKDAKLYGLEDY